MRFVSLGICLLGFATALAGVSPDRFDKIGSLPLDEIKSFAADSSRVCLLLEHTVALANTSSPGFRMSIGATAAIRQVYDDCYLNDERLYLYSRGGALGAIQTERDSLTVLAEKSGMDTIFSVAASGSYLYLAQGFDGISVVKISDPPSFRVVGRGNHGGYYSQVRVYDTMLFAVDLLNGIDVYRVRDSEIVYLRSLFTENPTTDFVVNGGVVLACDGTNRVGVLPVTGGNKSVTSYIVLDQGVYRVETLGNGLVFDFGNGDLGFYSFQTEQTIGDYQAGYPFRKLRTVSSSDHGARCYALDARGALTMLQGEALVPAKKLSLADLPQAMAATPQGLVMARAGRGLYLLNFESGIAMETLIFESSFGFASLSVLDSLLFAAVAGSDSVMILDIDAVPSKLVLMADIGIAARQLFVRRTSASDYELTAIAAAGAVSVSVNTLSGKSTSRWAMTSRFPVATGFYDGSSLVLTTESGDIDFYCVDCNGTGTSLEASAVSSFSPRAAVTIAGQFVVVGGAGGMSLFRYLESPARLEHVTDFLAVNSVSDLLYDPRAKIVFVAGGDDVTRFADFADPLSVGPLFSLTSSSGATSLAFASDRLYIREPDAVSCYEAGPAFASPAQAPRVMISEAFPNPFNSTTIVDVSDPGVAHPIKLDFRIVDILGRVVRQGELANGNGPSRISWDGTDWDGHPVASGVYFLRVSDGDAVSIRKMLLVK
jgi:hypothetical protein